MDFYLQDLAGHAAQRLSEREVWGVIAEIDDGVVRVKGLGDAARIADRVRGDGRSGFAGEIVSIRSDYVDVMPDSDLSGVALREKVFLEANDVIWPSERWLGGVLSSNGNYFDQRDAPRGSLSVSLDPSPLPVTQRRGLGERLSTRHAAFDTFLPICRGQRIGIFAGSGVGKSMLLASLARGLDADIVIIALIGERSREVREFSEHVLGPAGRQRSIVFAATCDESGPSKKRCAMMAIATAEYFRDQGKHVLVIFDSLTRYADAHREIALTAGEAPSLRAYPPSTFRAIARLAERVGPGIEGSGDITAIFSVLVAGSDMEEPIADMVRGILDGHVILDREIAERGRYPAINIRRSVSRSLPSAASAGENRSLSDARRLIAAYDDAAAMIQMGLYVAGSDPSVDRAIETWPNLEKFIGLETESCTESFRSLDALLDKCREKPDQN